MCTDARFLAACIFYETSSSSVAVFQRFIYITSENERDKISLPTSQLLQSNRMQRRKERMQSNKLQCIFFNDHYVIRFHWCVRLNWFRLPMNIAQWKGTIQQAMNTHTYIHRNTSSCSNNSRFYLNRSVLFALRFTSLSHTLRFFSYFDNVVIFFLCSRNDCINIHSENRFLWPLVILQHASKSSPFPISISIAFWIAYCKTKSVTFFSILKIRFVYTIHNMLLLSLFRMSDNKDACYIRFPII